MKTKSLSSEKVLPPEALMFHPDDVEFMAKYFPNPDVLWHMEEYFDGKVEEYVSEEFPIPEDCVVWVKTPYDGQDPYCIDIYHKIRKEWLHLMDMGLLCHEHVILTAPSLGCGKLEEIRAFVTSKPESKVRDGKMKGLLVRALTNYKKFYVPIPRD